MRNRLTLCILLSALILVGCAEKKSPKATSHHQGLPFSERQITSAISCPLPTSWLNVSTSTIRNSDLAGFIANDEYTFHAAYTGAPVAEVRLPFVFFASGPDQLWSTSEVHLQAQKALQEDLLLKEIKEPHTVNSKHYYPDKKLIIYDITIDYGNNISLNAVVSTQMIKGSVLVGIGMCALDDTLTMAALKYAAMNAVIDQDVKY